MTTRPPRAPTKGDGKRPKLRGSTHAEKSERPERPDRRRAASVVPTDRFERVVVDEVIETTQPSGVPQLRMLVLEGAPHVAAAQGAIIQAGHAIAALAAGREGIQKLRGAVGAVDALLVALPGGELLIDAALALGPRRPVVIAACTSNAVEAVRRAATAGADLVTVRPHEVERLAPILFAAVRLVAERRQLATAGDPAATPGEFDEPADQESGALQPFEVFQKAVELELERARRYAYPLAVAVFSVDIAQEPPPGVRGILRARAGNALVNAIRDVDLVTELDQDRFLVLLPYTDRLVGAEVARRIIGAVAAADPVIAMGRAFSPKLVGAVAVARPGEPVSFTSLVNDATQLLEQAAVTGASLAVDT